MNDVQMTIDSVMGFRVAGVNCGIKPSAPDKLDFALIVSDRPCTAAGVFTTNLVKAAPVLVDMMRLEHNAEGIRAVAINSGCANACTGRKGMQDAHITATWVAEAIGCREQDVLVMSTGVIGTHLPMDKIRVGVGRASAALSDDWHSAATAIMTTDTRPKMASVSVTTSSGQTYRIAGIAKGAGMIAPNMATLLSAVVTDASLTVDQAKRALCAAADVSFNCIVVDGDMSTNDTLVLLANGASGAHLATSDDVAQFETALFAVCTLLAQNLVRDGEGVTKFITIRVTGASDDQAARQIANAIATSALVKTAFYGSDANWGRIVAAAGRAGAPMNPERTHLWITPGETQQVNGESLELFAEGVPTEYDEARATAIVREASVSVLLDCGAGDGAATVWTCDLSHDYVSINGHYRT